MIKLSGDAYLLGGEQDTDSDSDDDKVPEVVAMSDSDNEAEPRIVKEIRDEERAKKKPKYVFVCMYLCIFYYVYF